MTKKKKKKELRLKIEWTKMIPEACNGCALNRGYKIIIKIIRDTKIKFTQTKR